MGKGKRSRAERARRRGQVHGQRAAAERERQNSAVDPGSAEQHRAEEQAKERDEQEWREADQRWREQPVDVRPHEGGWMVGDAWLWIARDQRLSKGEVLLVREKHSLRDNHPDYADRLLLSATRISVDQSGVTADDVGGRAVLEFVVEVDVESAVDVSLRGRGLDEHITSIAAAAAVDEGGWDWQEVAPYDGPTDKVLYARTFLPGPSDEYGDEMFVLGTTAKVEISEGTS